MTWEFAASYHMLFLLMVLCANDRCIGYAEPLPTEFGTECML